jgi:hypothetical protein
MTVCSFALHLIESPSELFALLWELRCVAHIISTCIQIRRLTNTSTKCRWLVVLAPHKKPEVHITFQRLPEIFWVD